jgi:hypothetical protein
MRILVFSSDHAGLPWMSSFPHVRGWVLADALRRAGADAEFRALPVAGAWDVAICSDYQGDEVWLGKLQRRMAGLSARRFYCMADSGTPVFSKPMIEWFAARGGVLVHLAERPLAPYEHYIGVGVAARHDPDASRTDILFDFPNSSSVEAWRQFDPHALDAVRRALPDLTVVGSGAADCPIRDHFDRWVAYGLPHAEYVATFTGCVAFVAGCRESMGQAAAEAQVAGACIAGPPGRIKAEMLVPAADACDADLVAGLLRARAADHTAIARDAAARFSAAAMAERVLAALVDGVR